MIGLKLGADALRPLGAPLRLRQADRRRPARRAAGDRARRSKDYSGSSIGNLPIGQGLAVTPIQMAAAYTAIANGGVMPRPTSSPATASPAGACSRASTADEVSKMLEGVLAAGGTAPEAAVAGYTLAGKTGTAEKPDERWLLEDQVRGLVHRLRAGAQPAPAGRR